MAAMFIPQEKPTSILIAQAVGITASTYLFGQNCGLSFCSAPAVMDAPAPLAAKQWAHFYHNAKPFGPALALLTTAATGYLAYQQESSSTAFKLNVASALLLPAIVPFTLLVIQPTNDALFAKCDQLAAASLEDKAVEKGVAQGETVHALIDKWAMLNLARAAIVGAGAICATVAALL